MDSSRRDGTLPGREQWQVSPHHPPLPPPRPHRFKSAAALLALFLGDLGAHNFYLTQIVRGISHVLLLGAGVGLFLTGQDVSRELPDTAGIPAGLMWNLAGLAVLASNAVWRWVEFFIILATPEDRLGRRRA